MLNGYKGEKMDILNDILKWIVWIFIIFIFTMDFIFNEGECFFPILFTVIIFYILYKILLEVAIY